MRREEALRILGLHREDLRARGVLSLALFGSVARDEANSESDIDILVELRRPAGYFALGRLKIYLEEILGGRVDLATPGALRPEMRDEILAEIVRAS